MAKGSNDIDRDILGTQKAFWADDPEQNLTEAELDHVLDFLSASACAKDPCLRRSLKMQFQFFMAMAEMERLSAKPGAPEQVSKPSTIVKREMEQINKACNTLDQQLAGLDPVTKTWLDQHLEKFGVKDKSNRRVRLRDLEEQIFWPLDILIFAARSTEGMTSRGPNNMAQRIMVERLADCWEHSFGEPPTTDKGEGRRDDPFLELCQQMSGIAHARLQKKGSGFSILELSGLVDDVLKKRRSRSVERPWKK